jgi:hypothetical protein
MITVKEFMFVDPDISFTVDLSKGVKVELQKIIIEVEIEKKVNEPGNRIFSFYCTTCGKRQTNTYLSDQRLEAVVPEILGQGLRLEPI